MKTFLLSSLVCLLTVVSSANNPKSVVEGNSKFAFRLLHQLQIGTTGQNLIFSPFSISTALAMVYAGAKNETALQMERTLNFQTNGNFNADFRHLLDKLDQGANGQIKLNIANGLWAQHDFKFLDGYFEVAKTDYYSALSNVDFKDAAARENCRRHINQWVEEKTNDKIKGLIGKDDLSGLTRLVLVNAIYFYGEWAEPFKKESTSPDEFSLKEGTRVMAPFMNQHKKYNYYEDSVMQAIEIPYKNDKASMLIFLPKWNKLLPEFEKSFDYQYYQKIAESLELTDVRLSFPKFKTDFKLELADILSQMGMPLAFSQDSADFSGMTGKPNLHISKVIHQAFIAADEKGTEAAAATAVTMNLMAMRDPSEVKVFHADHPFLFIIKDTMTGSILFMGKIMKPEVAK